jgi:hypothetical protein
MTRDGRIHTSWKSLDHCTAFRGLAHQTGSSPIMVHDRATYPVPKPGAVVHNTVLWGVDTLQVAVRVSPVLTLVYVALTGVLEGPKFEPTRATCVPPAVFSVTRGLVHRHSKDRGYTHRYTRDVATTEQPLDHEKTCSEAERPHWWRHVQKTTHCTRQSSAPTSAGTRWALHRWTET